MTTPATGPNNATPNQNTQQRQNTPGSRPASSPFAARQAAQPQAAAPAAPAPGTAPAANNNTPAGSLLRRPFGNQQQQESLQWTVAPLGKTGVRFQLGGLGDPFHRLLETPLNTEYGNPAKVIQALQEDAELREKLEVLLEEAWASYQFRGAAILFPWETEVRRAFTRSPLPDQPPQANNTGSKEEASDDESWLDDLAAASGNRTFECVRAIDLLFVLNILARARTQILVEGTPLALEPGFLDQVYVSDDPRLVALAQATGCIEEVW